jgi:hypothetical protein
MPTGTIATVPTSTMAELSLTSESFDYSVLPEAAANAAKNATERLRKQRRREASK